MRVGFDKVDFYNIRERKKGLALRGQFKIIQSQQIPLLFQLFTGPENFPVGPDVFKHLDHKMVFREYRGDFVQKQLFRKINKRHGLEVGEHTAQPAGVDIVHTDALGLFLDGIGGLLFGADEKEGAVVLGQGADEVIGLFQLLHGLLEIDDVDAVALAVNVLGHLGVPAAGLVSEVDAGFQQLLHGRILRRAPLPPHRRAEPGHLGNSGGPFLGQPYEPAPAGRRRQRQDAGRRSRGLLRRQERLPGRHHGQRGNF